MIKNYIALLSLLTGVTAYAQTERVGINTITPQSTLDVQSLPTDNIKGVLVPRVTVAEIKAMTPNLTVAQNSMMTYLTETLPTGDRTGSYVLVSDPGFYY